MVPVMVRMVRSGAVNSCWQIIGLSNGLVILKYIPLPGGDTAIRKPARIALAYLWASKLDWDPEFQPVAASMCRGTFDIKISIGIENQYTSNIKHGTIF